jgi:hypothetical protein
VRRALRPAVSGKLSRAAYETLAIVAYQQPVPRSRIEEVRGVNCDSVLTNLELRDLITEVGRGSGPGQPKLYGTTMRFLQVMAWSRSTTRRHPPGADAPQRARPLGWRAGGRRTATQRSCESERPGAAAIEVPIDPTATGHGRRTAHQAAHHSPDHNKLLA